MHQLRAVICKEVEKVVAVYWGWGKARIRALLGWAGRTKWNIGWVVKEK